LILARETIPNKDQVLWRILVFIMFTQNELCVVLAKL